MTFTANVLFALQHSALGRVGPPPPPVIALHSTALAAAAHKAKRATFETTVALLATATVEETERAAADAEVWQSAGMAWRSRRFVQVCCSSRTVKNDAVPPQPSL